MESRQNSIDNILASINKGLRDFGKGFEADYGIGREDTQQMFYTVRDLQGKDPNAPRWDTLIGTNPTLFRIKEATGNITPEERNALELHNMHLRGSALHKFGQGLGTVAADLTQDRSRSIYWLLNALQASGEVINEKVLAKAVPSLYQRSPVLHPNRLAQDGSGRKVLTIGDKEDEAYMVRNRMIRAGNDTDNYVPMPGYSFENKELRKRNYAPGMVQALAIPTGLAINQGLGLLTPFGGYEGYKAAAPSQEDPSKTANVLGEVALKYVMGRTGNLLPYEEFKKVRPDVSREEYNRYQAFKYDKREDYNPLDGDVSIGAGALRATTEGIHGPEIQFLGRSLPLTTGVVPFTTALIGGVLGARRGAKRLDAQGKPAPNAAMQGLLGGTAGVAVGTAVGNIIEQERRRRNSVENELEGSTAESYLR